MSGEILRTHRSCPGAYVPNATAHDSRLCLDTLGLLAMLLAHGDSWHIRMRALITDCSTRSARGTAGPGWVRRMLRELQAAGYLRRVRTRDADGRWLWESHLYDAPCAQAPVPVAPTPAPAPPAGAPVSTTEEIAARVSAVVAAKKIAPQKIRGYIRAALHSAGLPAGDAEITAVEHQVCDLVAARQEGDLHAAGVREAALARSAAEAERRRLERLARAGITS